MSTFLRLIVVIEREPENKIEEYLDYDSCQYPMSLFKDGVLRSAKMLAFKNFLQKSLATTQEIESTKIADVGALLWCSD